MATALVAFVRAGRWQQRAIKSRISGRRAPAVPRDFRGTAGGIRSNKLLMLLSFWWAHKGSNLGTLPCEVVSSNGYFFFFLAVFFAFFAFLAMLPP
jgi:hypothetical protein